MKQSLCEIGSPGPEIDLPRVDLREGEGAGRWRLSSFRGRVVALFFYPADETMVCTKQLCGIRDRWEEYRQTGAEIAGISSDSVESHRRFISHHGFPFPLLADEERVAARAYGMLGPLGTKRGVVVVDGAGVVRYRKVVFPVFRPSDDEVLAAIRAL